MVSTSGCTSPRLSHLRLPLTTTGSSPRGAIHVYQPSLTPPPWRSCGSIHRKSTPLLSAVTLTLFPRLQHSVCQARKPLPSLRQLHQLLFLAATDLSPRAVLTSTWPDRLVEVRSTEGKQGETPQHTHVTCLTQRGNRKWETKQDLSVCTRVTQASVPCGGVPHSATGLCSARRPKLNAMLRIAGNTPAQKIEPRMECCEKVEEACCQATYIARAT